MTDFISLLEFTGFENEIYDYRLQEYIPRLARATVTVPQIAPFSMYVQLS